MVQVTIRIRPKQGYCKPRSVKSITVDSSERLEQIIKDLKLDTKKGIDLFSPQGKVELALNSSVATNNLQNNDVLETCSCPLLSTVISALLEDFNRIQTIPEDERTQDRLLPVLGLQPSQLNPWPDRWDSSSLKTRVITLALLKKIMQRQDRYAKEVIPSYDTLEDYHSFLHHEIFSDNEKRSSKGRVFSPSNKDGVPTTCWKLLQFKLDRLNSLDTTIGFTRDFATTEVIALTKNGEPIDCKIERFLVVEKERHERLNDSSQATPLGATATTVGRSQTPSSQSSRTAKRTRRRLFPHLESPSVRLADREWKCETCQTARADCMCLDAGCPFFQHTSCTVCFLANHPPMRSQHEKLDLSDPRVKTVLKQRHQQSKSQSYCPEYASGPFAVLCTLYDRMMHYSELSLTESRLKFLSQPICRSNLYDHQARGRNAFACIEGLMARELVRMERIPGRHRNEADGKYSLLPQGEALAKRCWEFEQEFQATVHNHPAVVQSRRSALKWLANGNTYDNRNNPVAIIVDTREDEKFAERLLQRCQHEQIAAEKRELPAGDYIFLENNNVCPIVIERKSWSDLADSVLGKGKRRLDCVRLDSASASCEIGRCQLCKMKQSGCPKIMFVVEGSRCLNLDLTPDKCTAAKRCQYCLELQQRHGRHVTQAALEGVLYRLQVDHGCFIHYTRSYNETITALMQMREILGAGNSGAANNSNNENEHLLRAIELSQGESSTGNDSNKKAHSMEKLSYEHFCSNARRRSLVVDDVSTPAVQEQGRKRLEELEDHRLMCSIFNGTMPTFCNNLCSGDFDGGQDTRCPPRHVESPSVIDLNESFNVADKSESDSSFVVELPDKTVIEIDSDEQDLSNGSQESVQIIDAPDIGLLKDSDEVEVLLTIPSDATPTNGRKDGSSTVAKVDSPSSTILLIFGLTENDTELYKDAHKIWKSLYMAKKDSGSASNVFRSLCKTEISRVQSNQAPFVERKAIMFWLLYMQLRGIQVHAMRQKHDRHLLQSRIKLPDKSFPAAANHFIGQPPSKRRKIVQAPTEALKCIICNQVLGEHNLEVTVCLHSFHSDCLHDWLSSQSKANRRCPTCRHVLGTFKDDSVSDTPQATSGPSSSYSIPVNQSVEMQRAREARLSRFDSNRGNSSGTGRPPRPPSIQRSPRFVRPSSASFTPHIGGDDDIGGWACEKCTYRNKVLDVRCSVCNAARPGNANWACGKCTFKNPVDNDSCSMCGHPRCLIAPISQSSAREVSLTDRDAKYTPVQAAAWDAELPGSSSASASKRQIKCGACGEYGHNRSTAKPHNCPAYYDEDEVRRRSDRQKKAEERKRKNERDAQERINELEREQADTMAYLEETQRAMANLQQSTAAAEKLRQNEIKRQRQKLARAKKRAS